MAMAPWLEHERLLHAALQKATLKLQGPIKRMEWKPGKICFSAGWWKKAEIAYTYVQDDSRIPGPAHFLLDGENFHDDEGDARKPNEHARLLHAALRKATSDLQRPIDRMEWKPGKIAFCADGKKIEIAYSYVPDDSKNPGPPHFLLDGEDFHDDAWADRKWAERRQTPIRSS
jgi:hypothetical protein